MLCFCEYKNGFGNKNKIICTENGSVVKNASCGANSGCTGPTAEYQGVMHEQLLCTKGIYILLQPRNV